MFTMKAAALQVACRGCRCLANALALPMLAFISLVTRSLAYVMQHEPDQAPLHNPLEPSTHAASPSSPIHLASAPDMESSMTPSSPASPVSPLVRFSFQRNFLSSSVEAPCFQCQLPSDLTPAQQQCVLDLLDAQQLHYEAKLTDEVCQQAAQHEVHEEEVEYLQQLAVQEQQWRQEDLACAHKSTDCDLQLRDIQLADQRQQIADLRQHYKLKLTAERRQAAWQQQLHAAELSDLHQQLADQQESSNQELTEVCQQLMDSYAEQLAEALAHQHQQHAGELNGLRQNVQELLHAERQQTAAVQQGYSEAMEALALERESRAGDRAQSTAQVQQLTARLHLSQYMLTQQKSLLEIFCSGPTGYHQLQAELTAALQENAELSQQNDLLSQQAQAMRSMQHPVYRADVSSSFMTCMLLCLPQY